MRAGPGAFAAETIGPSKSLITTGTRVPVNPLIKEDYMSFLREGLQVFFRCSGSDFQPTHQFLQGRADGSVGLTGNTTDDGTLWTAHIFAEPDFSFECIGRGFLDGNTVSSGVALAPNVQPPFTGTKWRVADLPDPGTHVTLQCKGEFPGPFTDGFLDGHTGVNDGNVFLANDTAPRTPERTGNLLCRP